MPCSVHEWWYYCYLYRKYNVLEIPVWAVIIASSLMTTVEVGVHVLFLFYTNLNGSH